MRLLHVIPSMNPADGGPVEGVLRLASSWRKSGHVTEIVSLDAPGDPWVIDSPIVIHPTGPTSRDVRLFGRALPLAKYGYTPRLAPWLARNAAGYDGIIVNGLWNYTSLGAHRGLRKAGVPYHVFTHGMLDPWFGKAMPLKQLFKHVFWTFADGPLVNDATSVLFTTEDERDLARGQFKPYRIRERVVGYGTADVDGDPSAQAAAFRAAVPQVGSRRHLLFLSRIHPKKGCDLLIKAFARIADRENDLDLVMAGPDQVGLRASLQQMADAAGVGHRIHWPGMLTGDAKWGAFRLAEAFVLTSHQENFGVAVAEALALSRPVLITNKVNIWREVESAGAGLVSTDTDEGAYDLLTRFLAANTSERAAMGAAGRELFLSRFHVDRFAETVLDVLREGAGPKAKPAPNPGRDRSLAGGTP